MQSLVKMITMVALLLFISPLLEGILRKFKALVHSRIGPPLLQPYWDTLKLLGKDNVRSVHSMLGPLPAYLSLAAVLLAGLLVPVGGTSAFAGGDMILFLYMIGFASVCVMLAGMDSGSPYAFLGIAREMMTSLTVEPVLFIALITAALKTHSFRFSDMAFYQQSSGTSLSMIISGIALLLGIRADLRPVPLGLYHQAADILPDPGADILPLDLRPLRPVGGAGAGGQDIGGGLAGRAGGRGQSPSADRPGHRLLFRRGADGFGGTGVRFSRSVIRVLSLRFGSLQ